MEDSIRERVMKLYAHQPMFRQAVLEFLESVLPYLESVGAESHTYARLERMLIPERIITFKVIWENDRGELEHNLGCRIQFNSALGPYKGGLRFDPTVTEDVLKFLGFEQIFKNALTGLPLGGGKGGSDFDPKGKSDKEVWRFCTAFMTELAHHIGPYTDVPAGDIGVGSREIGYLYGAYKKITNRTDGVLTGKGVDYNGSHIRMEATGYGAIYFIKHMLAERTDTIEGKSVAISGSGNVALYAAKKCIEEGARLLALSDRNGYVYHPGGFDRDFVETVKRTKDAGKQLESLALPEGASYHEGKFWKTVRADICIPAATQNELDAEDARKMLENGVLLVAEAANMPSTQDAAHVFRDASVLFAPGKAVNAGGVAVSGLEMTQNAGHMKWSQEEVDAKLRYIMRSIHDVCKEYGTEADRIDYVKGANVGGFIRVLRAMEQFRW